MEEDCVKRELGGPEIEKRERWWRDRIGKKKGSGSKSEGKGGETEEEG